MAQVNSERLSATSLPAHRALSTASIAALFVFVVLAWGLNWVVMKIVVQEMTPLWAVAVRTLIAFVVLLPAVTLTGRLVAVIALFHMVAFAALMTAGLKYVSAGRTIVLGYTTPL